MICILFVYNMANHVGPTRGIRFAPKQALKNTAARGKFHEPVSHFTNRIIPYDERIGAIMRFLGISQAAAGFIYHRKRRGAPFTRPENNKFLEWSLRLQNALVKADECIGWDWEEVRFGEEAQALARHDIYIENQSDSETYRNVPSREESDGWTVVKSERDEYKYNKTLQIMGFGSRRRTDGGKGGAVRPPLISNQE